MCHYGTALPAFPDAQLPNTEPGSPALLAKHEENRIPIQYPTWNPCPCAHCDVLEIYRAFLTECLGFSKRASSTETVCCLNNSDQFCTDSFGMWRTIQWIPESYGASSVLGAGPALAVFSETLFCGGLANSSVWPGQARSHRWGVVAAVLMDGEAQSCCYSFALDCATISWALGWLTVPFHCVISCILSMYLLYCL